MCKLQRERPNRTVRRRRRIREKQQKALINPPQPKTQGIPVSNPPHLQTSSSTS
ncbi:hypothetical protein BJ508DRAFT_171968 [Ascobolus immersus RN42]|uniref:Uncharacterized protein n=1 Tax=Ascobolus immersus RN42 TaxID=1160509 RepID=A0A3N4HVU5_ASCIM|nr:hypothetical protein BJ508DRAFT_171968 [Ascobolus immersus RN42]